MTVLEVCGLSHCYAPHTPFEKTALSAVSFSVEEGEFLGVIGHTGSGKSTLIQHLNGLLRPTDGTVKLAGRDIWEKPKEIRKVRFEVGMVFQYPEHQLFEETVFKDIAFGPRNMGLSEKEIDGRVKEAAAFTGLSEELLAKSPFELSGGQKRRAAIAGVMAMRPKVLILDEPTAGLDPRGRDQLLERIVDYRRQTGATVILVSHSMEDVARVTERVLVMHEGHLCMDAPVSVVFSRAEELMTMGLSVPAVTEVGRLLQELGCEIGEDIYTVDQAVRVLLPHLKGGAARAE